MNRRQPEKKFIILDDNQQTLASAILMEQQGQRKIFELTSTPSIDLLSLPAINILSLNSTEFMAWRGKVERLRGDQFYFWAEDRIDERLRRHLRIPMSFQTYLYPVSGVLFRLPVVSKDISCGGIAIYSMEPLLTDQVFEIALPCTEPPLLVRLKVLRPLPSGSNLYSCQFVDLLPAEEAMIRECIFEYDLHHHSA